MPNPYILLLWIFTLILAAAAGWNERGVHEDAAKGKGAQQVIKGQAKAEAKATALDGQQAKAGADQVVKDRIIIKEVAKYVQVTRPADRCQLPGTWRVRHDRAALGDPAGAGGVAESPSEPVSDAAALDTVAENYTACRWYARQVAGWNDWCDAVDCDHQTAVAEEGAQ